MGEWVGYKYSLQNRIGVRWIEKTHTYGEWCHSGMPIFSNLNDLISHLLSNEDKMDNRPKSIPLFNCDPL